MINKITIVLAILCSLTIYGQNTVNIIPKPQKVILHKGFFELTEKVSIKTKPETMKMAILLQSYIYDTSNIMLNINKKSTNNNLIDLEINTDLEIEGYSLIINEKGIVLKGGSLTGLYYGIQTIRQLMPVTSEKTKDLTNRLKFQILEIEDSPRFKWRAFMLDEARYFYGEEFVKLLLDQMASIKMNVFHWHLTDDAGWRIEIKKYPNLTKIGSKRKDSEIGTWGSGKLSGQPHSGFYTQEQIKDIVAYAAERHITIVPEFEIPGHSSAAIASYPWLGTYATPIEVPVKFGRKKDIYDITNPKVVEFIHDVLNEIFSLFPSEVIHIGGDEVAYDAWRESKSVQEYMQKNGLKTPADLQVFFTNNLSKYIEKNDRIMMGWNEIMGINIHPDHEEKALDKSAETTLAENVIVHFWKGNIDLVTKAAEQGHGIVNSLHSMTYLDYSYEDLSLKNAYDFDPIPKELDKKYHKNIYGLGCQMWTEWTPTKKDVMELTFPRIAAFAEVGWTNTSEKNFEEFNSSLKILQKRWDLLNINYSKILE
ncbi:MAG: beta-N-acetylhexosaminidase [Bacteroidota bacterium]